MLFSLMTFGLGIHPGSRFSEDILGEGSTLSLGSSQVCQEPSEAED